MKPTRLLTHEHASVLYYHAPEVGVSIDDLLSPEYWAHVSASLRPGFRIECFAADGAWWAMLIVRASGKNEAFVHALDYVPLGEAAAAMPEQSAYTVKWAGPNAKFRVLRASDGEVIKSDFQLREHAEAWVANHMKSLDK